MKKLIFIFALLTTITAKAGISHSKVSSQEAELEHILKTKDTSEGIRFLEEQDCTSNDTTKLALHTAILEGNLSSVIQIIENIRTHYGPTGLALFLKIKLPVLIRLISHKRNLTYTWVPPGLPYGVPNLLWGGGGDMLVSTSLEGTVHIWDTKEPTQKWTIKHTTRKTPNATWNPKNNMIATIAGDVKVWDGEQKKLITTIKHNNAIGHWSHDGKMLATASSSGKVKIWHISQPNEIMARQKHDAAVYRMAWSPCATLLVTASLDGIAAVWQINDTEIHRVDIIKHEGTVLWLTINWSPDGSKLALNFFYDETSIHIWDISRRKTILIITQHNTAGVAWHPNSTIIATYGRAHTSQIWDCESIELLDTINGSDAVEWSPDGRMLISAIWMKHYKIWSLTEKRTLLIINQWPCKWKWSGDSTMLATASKASQGHIVADPGMGYIWNLQDDFASRIASFRCPADYSKVLDWSPDSNMLAICSSNREKSGTVEIWSRKEKQIVGKFSPMRVLDLAWNRKSTFLATAGTDKIVKIWNAIEKRVVASIKHTDEVWRLVWNHDGDMLSTGSKDGMVQIWHVPGSALDFAMKSVFVDGVVTLLLKEYTDLALNLNTKGLFNDSLLVNTCNFASTCKNNPALYEKLCLFISQIANTPGAPL